MIRADTCEMAMQLICIARMARVRGKGQNGGRIRGTGERFILFARLDYAFLLSVGKRHIGPLCHAKPRIRVPAVIEIIKSAVTSAREYKKIERAEFRMLYGPNFPL